MEARRMVAVDWWWRWSEAARAARADRCRRLGLIDSGDGRSGDGVVGRGHGVDVEHGGDSERERRPGRQQRRAKTKILVTEAAR